MMGDDFFKFPSTPHLAVLPGLDIRADKALGEAERECLLRRDITVEEKVDGANLGISLDQGGRPRAQNRGAYLRLPEGGQWRPLQGWLEQRADSLREHLGDRYILFGEWCFAKHAILYDRLPDWFLAFDVFDRASRRFLAVPERDRLFQALRVAQVPRIADGRFSLARLVTLLGPSSLTNAPAEGLYVRQDQGPWLEKRAKLVAPAFVQSMDVHWSRAAMTPNRLGREVRGGFTRR